jgi:membrane-associated phospholipid phosphatase
MAPFLALFFLMGRGVGFLESVSWITVWILVALVPTALVTYFTGERKLNIESGPSRRRGYVTGISGLVISLVLTWFLSAPEPVLNLGFVSILSAVMFGTANHLEKVSVHTGALAGFSGIFLVLSPVISGSFAALAAVVGLSRVELEMHTRDQVLGGAFLGALCGLTVLVL